MDEEKETKRKEDWIIRFIATLVTTVSAALVKSVVELYLGGG